MKRFFLLLFIVGTPIALLRVGWKIPAYIAAVHNFPTRELGIAVVTEAIIWDFFTSYVIAAGLLVSCAVISRIYHRIWPAKKIDNGRPRNSG